MAQAPVTANAVREASLGDAWESSFAGGIPEKANLHNWLMIAQTHAAPARHIPQGFVASSQQDLRASQDVDDIHLANQGKVSEAALARLCLRDPHRFENLVKGGLNLTAYPTFAKTVLDGAANAKDLSSSLRLLKQAGARIEWDELRHGARVLKTKDFLVLMRHSPSCDTIGSADLFSNILADHTKHVPDVLRADIGPRKDRFIQALRSLRPELMKDLSPHLPVASAATPRPSREDSAVAFNR